MDDSTLIYDGGSVKALDDDGRIGGHLVLWGSEAQPDATSYKDYFEPDTDFWVEDWPAKAVLLYHHGLDGTLKSRRLGSATLKADDAGIWLEGQLKLRDEYERKIYEAVRQGRMGLSSGSVTHLVRRERKSSGAHKITSWPIYEASITPTPGEPRTAAVALKTIFETSPGPGTVAGPTLDDRSDRLVADLEELCGLYAKAIDQRRAEGRHLSATKLGRLDDLHSHLGRLVAAARPKADPERLRAVDARLARLQHLKATR